MIFKNADSKSINELSALYDIKESTVRAIIKNIDSRGICKGLPKGGDHRSKLSPSQKEKIREWVDENAAIRLKDLKNKLETNFENLSVSISTIDRVLRNFHYTLKNNDCSRPKKLNQDN